MNKVSDATSDARYALVGGTKFNYQITAVYRPNSIIPALSSGNHGECRVTTELLKWEGAVQPKHRCGRTRTS
jgi:hypothetical protein